MRYNGSISIRSFIIIMKQSIYSQDTRPYNTISGAYARLQRGIGGYQKRVNVW